MQRGNQSCPCDWCVSCEKWVPADFNPILSFSAGKTATIATELYFLKFGFGQATTRLKSVKETIPVLEHSRIQRVMVVVVFLDSLERLALLNILWTAMKQSTKDFFTGQKHQRLHCFPVTRKAELPDYGFTPMGILLDHTNQSSVFTCYGVVKLSLFFFSCHFETYYYIL